MAKSVVASVYGENRGESALRRSLCALFQLRNSAKIHQLCEELVPHLGREEMAHVFKETNATGKHVDEGDAARMKCARWYKEKKSRWYEEKKMPAD